MAPRLRADLARRYGGSEYCSTPAAADLLNVSISFLNKKRLDGTGPPFVKFGKTVRYELDALFGWAASRTRKSTSDTGQAA
jgi:hypothetical protein